MIKIDPIKEYWLCTQMGMFEEKQIIYCGYGEFAQILMTNVDNEVAYHVVDKHNKGVPKNQEIHDCPNCETRNYGSTHWCSGCGKELCKIVCKFRRED